MSEKNNQEVQQKEHLEVLTAIAAAALKETGWKLMTEGCTTFIDKEKKILVLLPSDDYKPKNFSFEVQKPDADL